MPRVRMVWGSPARITVPDMVRSSAAKFGNSTVKPAVIQVSNHRRLASMATPLAKTNDTNAIFVFCWLAGHCHLQESHSCEWPIHTGIKEPSTLQCSWTLRETLMPTVERLIHALWPWLLSKERAFYLSLYVCSKRLGANFAPERPECVSAFARGFGHGYVTNAIENNGSRLR